MKLIEVTTSGHHRQPVDGLLIGQRRVAHHGDGPNNYSVWTEYWIVAGDPVSADDARHAAAFGRNRRSSWQEVTPAEAEPFVPAPGHTYGGRQNHLSAARVAEIGGPALCERLGSPTVASTPGWEDYYTPRQVFEAYAAALATARA